MESYSNTELTEGIKNRDNEILEYIIRRYKPLIRAAIRKMGGQPEDANDVFHDGLLTIIEKVIYKDFKITGDLINVLYIICTNYWKDKIKRDRVADNYYSSTIRQNEYVDFSDEFDRELYEKALWNALSKLGELCRNITELFLKEMPLKKIAEYLNYSYDYIRRKHRACLKELSLLARNQL